LYSTREAQANPADRAGQWKIFQNERNAALTLDACVVVRAWRAVDLGSRMGE